MRRLCCDHAGCCKSSHVDDSRWWIVTTDEVIGGVGTGRRIERQFCSLACLSDWADAELGRSFPMRTTPDEPERPVSDAEGKGP